jgi:glutathione S-transferase
LAQRPFISGERFSIADITAWVAIDLGIPSVFEIGTSWPHLSRWHKGVSPRPSANA